MKSNKRTAEKMPRIHELLQGKKCMLIVMQDNPDPDAIASAAGLRELANKTAGVSCFICHGGIVGRSENRALIRYLDLKLHRIQDLELQRFDLIAMVDTQPGAGNNSLPVTIEPHIVIDHHPMRKNTRCCPFTDIRSRYGATATILREYLYEAGVELETQIATALLYGIRSDTQNLGRDTTQADIDAFFSLYPLANKRMLSRIEWGPVPRVYFQLMTNALRNAKAYDHCIVAGIGDIDNPDMISEIADLLLRDDGCEWVMCFGIYEKEFRLSLRTSDGSADAGKVARRIAGRKGSGGGHNMLAAARIPLNKETRKERTELERLSIKRFLQATGAASANPTRLVQIPGNGR